VMRRLCPRPRLRTCAVCLAMAQPLRRGLPQLGEALRAHLRARDGSVRDSVSTSAAREACVYTLPRRHTALVFNGNSCTGGCCALPRRISTPGLYLRWL
jgi:hypothetical protein